MTPKTQECWLVSEGSISEAQQHQPAVLDRFETGHGYTTRRSRTDYIKALGLNEDDVPVSLDASLDSSKPLYPWQVYSLLGDQAIYDLISKFYKNVYDDDEDKDFRRVFTSLATMQHHIMAQTKFWIDAMGGGRAYHGGDGRLNSHHECNAYPIMNAAGAKRWMHHMRSALSEVEWDAVDARIIPCVLVFLKMKMQKYAKRHNWEFDESDFHLTTTLEGDEPTS